MVACHAMGDPPTHPANILYELVVLKTMAAAMTAAAASSCNGDIGGTVVSLRLLPGSVLYRCQVAA